MADSIDLIVKSVVEDSFPTKLPYHNAEHCLWVAEDAVWLFEQEKHFYPPLGEQFLKDFQGFSGHSDCLWLAGAFHDAGYPGDEDDHVNVLEALEQFRKFANDRAARETPLDVDLDLVSSLIADTEFPHQKPRTFLGGFIQDADALQTVLHPSLMEALSKELGKPVTDETTQEFIKKLHTNTVTGRWIADYYLSKGTTKNV